ncbi:MAG: biotin/lipoyl-binding protein, partial [Calditrichaeota bacterium]
MNTRERISFSPGFYKVTTIGLLVLILFWGLWQSVVRNGAEEDGKDTLSAPDIGADAPIPVRTAKAFRGDLVVRITTSGKTRAVRQVVFHAEVPGRVRRVPVREGQAVRRGALLFQLEDEDYRL